MAMVPTSFNTCPFAFRWKMEQGYLDNYDPNGGAMVKCLAIKQFNSVLTVSLSEVLIQYAAWMIIIIRNGLEHQFTVHVLYILTWSNLWLGIQPLEGSVYASRENTVSIQTKCCCQHCKIFTFAHKSCYSVIVYQCSEVRLIGWPFHFVWKKKNMQTSGKKPELSAFISLYFIIFETC